MKRIEVYGADLTKSIAEFDTVNEAMVYAKKGLRNNGQARTIRITEYHKNLYTVRKINGELMILDIR